jgi:hypothetical protein
MARVQDADAAPVPALPMLAPVLATPRREGGCVMPKGKPVAAGVCEPDDDLWVELADEWEAFIRELEAEEEGHRGQAVNG